MGGMGKMGGIARTAQGGEEQMDGTNGAGREEVRERRSGQREEGAESRQCEEDGWRERGIGRSGMERADRRGGGPHERKGLQHPTLSTKQVGLSPKEQPQLESY